LRIYDTVKKAYSVRSQVLHGDAISKKLLQQLRQLAAEMDLLVRSCLRAAIGDTAFAGVLGNKKEELEAYYRRIVLLGNDSSVVRSTP
jgi:hypothetical protein